MTGGCRERNECPIYYIYFDRVFDDDYCLTILYTLAVLPDNNGNYTLFCNRDARARLANDDVVIAAFIYEWTSASSVSNRVAARRSYFLFLVSIFPYLYIIF